MRTPTLEKVLQDCADDAWLTSTQFTGGEVRLVADALAAVTAERDQARQKLADAPHDDICESQSMYTPGKCDCWKAGL